MRKKYTKGGKNCIYTNELHRRATYSEKNFFLYGDHLDLRLCKMEDHFTNIYFELSKPKEK